MPSELILDLNEPDVATMVEGWVDGETYDLRVKARQTAPGKFEVAEVADETAEKEAEPEAAYPAAKPKAKGAKPAIVIK